jgi:hypothetical protein
MRPYLLALATALLVAAPAAAADAPKELRGSIAALSATSITVKDGSKSATCSVARTSPALADFRVGDRVVVVCKRTGDRWVLTAIRDQPKPKTTPAPPKTPPADETSLKQGGKLTEVSASSVTVHDGDRDFVCKRGDASPPLDGFHAGDRVVIACKGGVLTGITLVSVPTPQDPPKTEPPTTEPPKTTPPPVVERTGQGTLTSIRGDGVTVHTDGGDVICKLTDGSPKLGDYHVGDKVKFGCRNDVLLAIYKVDPPATTPTTPVYRTGQGTLTSIRGDGLTVHTDGGDVSCRLGADSPKLGDFHVGDHVKFYCTNDVLSGIARI